MTDQSSGEAIALMDDFAARTGLVDARAPTRYLWTDAFAVCNWLGLARTSGDARFAALALRLVEQVHRTLGRHRDDDARTGWISGLGEDEGARHPTRGGLRIGKRLAERGRDEPIDERLEWERDGQYFHYLTKWMHALDQAARAGAQPRLSAWARDLAGAAFRGFVRDGGRPRRMIWKASIDLARALVPSMGQHDPIDGLVTFTELRASAARLGGDPDAEDLERATRVLADIALACDWATPDPLGIGGLLFDAYRVAQLAATDGGALAPVTDAQGLLARLLGDALAGLHYYGRSGELGAPAGQRLAFRELGLAIGLDAVARMHADAERDPGAYGTDARERLDALAGYVALGDRIEAFWREPAQREAASWREHRDINDVMLATRLRPDGFLVLTRAG